MRLVCNNRVASTITEILYLPLERTKPKGLIMTEGEKLCHF
jgi:hypothetical protein